jgi:hypothetical protein
MVTGEDDEDSNIHVTDDNEGGTTDMADEEAIDCSIVRIQATSSMPALFLS